MTFCGWVGRRAAEVGSFFRGDRVGWYKPRQAWDGVDEHRKVISDYERKVLNNPDLVQGLDAALAADALGESVPAKLLGRDDTGDLNNRYFNGGL